MRANYERYVHSHQTVEFTDFQVYGNKAVWSAKIWEDHFKELGVTPPSLRESALFREASSNRTRGR